ncbi:Rne/Rng family ribonuclease [Indioceanicola profundi]|uniref:Rne/Rng family ribonuclease n=1 Tax=Indioceanicola profundi TaxID=2220096 RepID=UPI000E6AA5DE|nr:ribonuclease E/G [Indioceanicola profundi]
MAKRMLVDATHPEETRVVVVNGNKLEELDFEIASRKQLKGNIYLAKVIRVEPSLQAAFVEYGGNRHGFLAFSEIHPDYYRIPVADREALMREYERAAREEREEDEASAPELAEAEAESGSGVEDVPAGDEPVDEVGGTAPALPAGNGDDAADESGPSSEAHAIAPLEGAEGESPLASPAEQTVAAPDETVTEAPAEEPAKPKKRTTARRPRKTKAEKAGEAAAETPAEGADAGDQAAQAADGAAPAEGEKKKPVRRRKPKTVAMSAEPAESVEEEVEDVRKPRSVRPLKSYKIQEVIKRRQILLVQVTKEERGNKGAALTTYLSLPGRYCVLMPNTPRGGGISRKITNPADRKRLKDLLEGLDIPDGMSVILRTAGIERSQPEIKRDLEYLMRLWDNIREQTLQSVAPALIYEEANLIKRSIRDLYSQDVDDIWVEGEQGYRTAREFMRMLMPSHTRRVQHYQEEIPLFHRYQVEDQIDAMFNPVVQLKSGGYLVINQTEALVAIDVNSGRSTKERNIEETALKTNLEAADEVARQLRLRDLAGLIVIDFIDMEEGRNNAAVEKRLKEAMKADRARIQLGRISSFGLLELSRQRLRPSLQEINFERCPHCEGTGHIRSLESAALAVLRAIEEEGIRRRSSEITVTAATQITLYILNQKRDMLNAIERRYGFRVYLSADDSLIPPAHRLERIRAKLPGEDAPVAAITAERVFAETDRALEAEATDLDEVEQDDPEEVEAEAANGDAANGHQQNGNGDRDRRRRRRRRRGRDRDTDRGEGEQQAFGPAEDQSKPEAEVAQGFDAEEGEDDDEGDETEGQQSAEGENSHDANGDSRRKRRRGKRGGRRRARQREEEMQQSADTAEGDAAGIAGAQPAADVSEADASDITTPEVTTADAVPAAESATPEAMAATADVAPPGETVTEEAPAQEAPAPKKRATRSRKKATEDAAPEAAEAPAPKKRATRSRKKAAPEAAATEAPVAEAPAAEASATPAAGAAPAPEATDAPAAASAEDVPANPAITVNPPVEKPKKGWWSRLVKN